MNMTVQSFKNARDIDEALSLLEWHEALKKSTLPVFLPPPLSTRYR